MRHKKFLAFAMMLAACTSVARADSPADELAERLKALAPDVLPAEQRDAGRASVRKDQRERLLAANKQSSESWYAVKSRQQWEAFRKPRIDALRKSLGLFPSPPEELNTIITKTLDGDGFTIDNLLFQSRDGLWVTANLYKVAKPAKSMPGILICHSHHRPKEHGELQDMGMTWARAGCYVLVMDQLGHGERRQHPFRTAANYAKSFRASRQDYYFRYDTGIQLHLVGDSLVGWMAWDLMRGVDLLLEQDGIDPERIILLGAVAGGGDPAAVTGAIDDRIAAVVPFNFGGPQPETRYPLPDDAETSFNYAGSGGWESTRNLRLSANDGCLPWVIVGGIAPRRLIFSHEFGWDRQRDPVWRRLQTIYSLYESAENLAYAHGRGELKGRPPAATHCTHIGPPHRVMIHAAFRKWFDIPVTPAEEYSQRLDSNDLLCMTAKASSQAKPQRLFELLPKLVDERLAASRSRRKGSLEERAAPLRASLARVLGIDDWQEEAKLPLVSTTSTKITADVAIEELVVVSEGNTLPAIWLKPNQTGAQDMAVVVGVSQAGKAAFLQQRSHEIAALLAGGVSVCLLDLRETGEVLGDKGRGRNSSSTARSSTEFMLGSTMVGAKLRDLLSVIAHLRQSKGVDGDRIAVWGDSFANTNSVDTNFKVPRAVDGRPLQSEPLGGLLALLVGLYDEQICAVCTNGGLSEFRSVLDSQFVLIPHDVVIPGLMTVCDLPELAAAIAPRPLRLVGLVDGLNRRIAVETAKTIYSPAIAQYRTSGAADSFSIADDSGSLASWFLEQLKSK